jgi:hypothetical protein
MGNRRLLTDGVRVRSQVKSCEICGGQSGTWAGFFRVLRLPLPIFIPPPAPHSSSSSIVRGWYNRSVSGRRAEWTQSHPTPRNNKRKKFWLKHSFDLRDKNIYQVNGVFFLPNASRITIKTSILFGVLLSQQNHIRTYAAGGTR